MRIYLPAVNTVSKVAVLLSMHAACMTRLIYQGHADCGRVCSSALLASQPAAIQVYIGSMQSAWRMHIVLHGCLARLARPLHITSLFEALTNVLAPSRRSPHNAFASLATNWQTMILLGNGPGSPGLPVARCISCIIGPLCTWVA